MSLTARPLTDVASWTPGRGLEIILIVTGTILLTRLAAWLGAKITGRIDATARGGGRTGPLGSLRASARARAGDHVGHPGGHLLRSGGGPYATELSASSDSAASPPKLVR